MQQAQNQQNGKRQYRNVLAGNDQRVIGAGDAKILRPAPLDAARFADEGCLQQADGVLIAGIEAGEPCQGPGSEGKQAGDRA